MRISFSQTEKKIFSSDFEMSLRGAESNFCSMRLPGTISMSMGGLACNNFSEDGCMTDKFKVHSQIDNFGAEAELFQTIPFGTEFKVKRRFECASSFMRMTLDIDPGKGAIEDLQLEDIIFEGDLKKIRIFSIDGDKIHLDSAELTADKTVFYDGEIPPLTVQIEDSTGAFAEFGCGNDLWRHQTVKLYSHCHARFTVEWDGSKVIFRRHALKIEKDFVMPKRSFRFKYYTAFGTKAEKCSAEETLTVKGCMSAPANRRMVRDFLRKFNGSSVQIKAENNLCFDSSHLERPDREKLIHWSVEDFFEVLLWGSKLLSQNGAKLFFAPQNSDLNELGAMKITQQLLKNNINTEE